ncbi:MAG TPA: pyridoxamine 5'-phosphate oxidase [Saprospiraceae bacterium]|nr:pyridoxamine 5'-phosphate oxidase [Saprospiraceae bacterium]
MADYTQIRKSYTGPGLELSDVPDPIQLLHTWLEEALGAGIAEPNAMALSTVDSLGQPSSRMVLLRGLSERGLEFYTNYTSQKAVEMADNAQVALLFFWSSVHRQVRVEGHVVFSDPTASDDYFNERPREHQIGAWASPQSAAIPDRKAIEDNVLRYERMFEGKPVPRPSFWGGYLVIPQKIEFWQGRESRLHDRYRFQQTENGWKMERLAP